MRIWPQSTMVSLIARRPATLLASMSPRVIRWSIITSPLPTLIASPPTPMLAAEPIVAREVSPVTSPSEKSPCSTEW